MGFLSDLIAHQVAARSWRVLEPCAYRTRTGYVVVIPEDFETDLASTPRILWPLFPPFGRHTDAAILHDYLYHSQELSRADADLEFYQEMARAGVPFWQRGLMYAAVRIFGGGFYRG